MGAVLQGDVHQTGHDVVQSDQFRVTVRHFDAKEDLCRSVIVMHAEVERGLAGYTHLPEWFGNGDWGGDEGRARGLYSPRCL